MHIWEVLNKKWAWVVIPEVIVLVTVGCTTAAPQTTVRTTEYTSGGEVAEKRTETNGNVEYELRRVFENKVIEGVGIFENENEGLARKAAISLAVEDLAAKVQTEVRSNTVIYQNEDVRSTVETNVHSLVSNYRVDSEGYDPGSFKYRVRVSIRGEALVREIERVVQQ